MLRKDKGFSISFDDTRDILTTRVWGVWDEEFAEKYEYGFKEKIGEVCANGQIWGILADLRELLPRSEEVQRIIMLPDSSLDGARDQSEGDHLLLVFEAFLAYMTENA